jgi:DNA-binding NtrC family response regulator
MNDTVEDSYIPQLDKRLRRLRKDVLDNNRVVVVDDEEVIRQLMNDVLVAEGFEVSTVGSVAEAKESIRKCEPLVVVLDKNLPDGTGMDVLKYSFMQINPPEVVMITGFASFDSVVEAMHFGASAYLTKPFQNLNEIRAKVQEAVRRKRRKMLNRRFVAELKRSLKQLFDDFGEYDTTKQIYLEMQTNILEYEKQNLSVGRALVLGGNDRLKSFLDAVMKEINLEVYFADDKNEASKLLDSYEFHLILTDWNLSEVKEGNVIGTARELYPDVSIIMLSTSQSLDDALDAIKIGANEYLNMSLDDYDLFKQVVSSLLKTSVDNLRFRILIGELKSIFTLIAQMMPENGETLTSILY